MNENVTMWLCRIVDQIACLSISTFITIKDQGI